MSVINRTLLFLLTLISVLGEVYAQNVVMSDRDSDVWKEVMTIKPPNNYICQITVYRKRGKHQSSGFFVAGDMLLSSGNALRKGSGLFKNRIRKVRIKLFEHFDANHKYNILLDTTLSKSQIKALGTSRREMRKDTNKTYDYGYLLFKEPVKILKDETFKLKEYKNVVSDFDSLFITGYPSEKQYIKEGSLWKRSIAINDITLKDEMYLEYGVKTEQGGGGAPIWVKKGDEYFVVGIHNTGVKNQNGGTMVTRELINFLNKLRTKDP